MKRWKRSIRWWMAATMFAGCLLTSRVGAADPDGGSLRVVVQPEREWVLAGHPLNVSIGLRNAHNQPAPAPSALAITLVLIPPVPGAPATVTIPVGQSAATLQLQPAKPGILEIRAMH